MNISYSQFNIWKQCPYRYKLSYIDKINLYKGSVFANFGSAMHEVIEKYLETLYSNSISKANDLDLNIMLKESLKKEYTKTVKLCEGAHYSTTEEMIDLYVQGTEILSEIKKSRNKYFKKKGYKLIGTEIPLLVPITENIKFRGYIDFVIKDTFTNKIKLYDIKTSYSGWKDKKKKDILTKAQLIFYKKFYSEQFNIPIEDIEIEYFIVKRHIFTGGEWPAKRIQRFKPANGKPTINKNMKMLNEFIEECFDKNGDRIINKEYIKHKNIKSCQYCEYKNTEHCKKNNKRDIK
ncbi:MAG: PD-(D/E)XK nuclease family protein [Candidatus Cloacimonetes bacterium]|nr:PD-(D/E)XK nuclease family protein [Actinomycetota bacterium]MBL7085689.1 PD-(D/E)XK nuclease family protein [Candidatus Cloacimonadota bacterium]